MALESNHSPPRAMTLRVFVSGVKPSTPGSPLEASLRPDLALVASKKRDQSSAGNHLLAFEVDEAPFNQVEVNVVSTDASNGVGVDICCCDGHLTISPTLISAEDHSDSLRRLNGLHWSSHRFQATSCPGSHHRKPAPTAPCSGSCGRGHKGPPPDPPLHATNRTSPSYAKGAGASAPAPLSPSFRKQPRDSRRYVSPDTPCAFICSL